MLQNEPESPHLVFACCRTLALSVIMSCAVRSQLVPYPTWSTNPVPIESTAIFAALAPDLRGLYPAFLPSGCSHSESQFGWTLQSDVRSGVMAVDSYGTASTVRSPLGGLDTGLTEILYHGTSRTAEPQLGGPMVSIWSGRTAPGPFRVQWISHTAGATPSPTMIRNAACTSIGDEVWLTATILGECLYVLDGKNSRVIRFTCSSPSHDFDVRDPSFSAEIPPLGRDWIYEFKLDPDGLLRFETIHDHKLLQRRGITAEGEFLQEPIAPDPLRYPTLMAHPRGGVSTLGFVGGQGVVVYVEVGPSETGPFTVNSAKTMVTNRTGVMILPLKTPLVAGQWLRVRVPDAVTSEALRIAPIEPVIYSVTPCTRTGMVSAAAQVVVAGGNFVPGAMTAEFRVVVGMEPNRPPLPDVIPLTIVDASAERIQIILPDIAADGRLHIRAGTQMAGHSLKIRRP